MTAALTWDDDPTIEFGPRPHESTAPHKRRRGFERIAIAIGVSAVSIGVVLAMRSTETRIAQHCAPLTAGPAPELLVLDADVDGDGCTELVRWDPGNATLTRALADGRTQRLILGSPGDQVVLGDWECHGAMTPAVYHPADGTVTRFSAWPSAETGEVRGIPEPQQTANGHATVTRSNAEAACDRVVVER